MAKTSNHSDYFPFHPAAWFLSLCLLSFAVGPVHAQLTEAPIPPSANKRPDRSARIQSTTPLSLPFWDDFSTVEPGYPDTLWVNSNSVYISSGLGLNAPTINVATFDGLDSLGVPYNPNETSAIGFTDKLVSRPLLMTEVPLNERNTVYLSFFYQWRGYGEPPDNTDFLRVEFRDDQGSWVDVFTVHGDEVPDFEGFNTVILPVHEERWFHDGFQFRFRTYGRMSGPFDTWIVDYVLLNKGRDDSTPSFPDRAAASPMSRLFGPYYAMPLSHFLVDNTLDTVTFDVQNLRGSDFGGASINYRVNAKFYHYFGEDPPVVFGKNLIKSRGVKGTSGVMLPYERVTVRLDTLPDPSDPLQFDPTADAIDVQLKLKVISSDSIDAERPAFLPLDFRVNDTTSTWYSLRDYYAYDDGVAEYSAGLTQAGNRLAYQFVMRTDTATLAGILIYFPYLGGSNSQSLDLYIYGDDNGQPTQNPIYSMLGRTITKNSKNEFMYLPLQPPLFINDSVFYIGYREPVISGVKVGLDKSNDTGDRIFVLTGGTWQRNADVQGSLMIRPVFGGKADPVTAVPDEERGRDLYPNPNDGTFFLPGVVGQVEITDVMGRFVPWSIDSSGNDTRVTLNSPSPGMYLVKWVEAGNVRQRKVLVR